MNWEEDLLRLLAQPGYSPLDDHELRKRLAVPPKQRSAFDTLLQRLERTGRIARIRQNRYALPADADLIPGRIMMNRSGAGILQPDDPRLPRIVIPVEATATALHLDRVLVRRDTRPPVKRSEDVVESRGKVIRVLESARNRVVGTLQRSKKFFYIVPDDPRIPHDIYVPAPDRNLKPPPRVGQKVVVELEEWLSRHTNPEGRIVKTLGEPDDPDVEMLSILQQYGLPSEFPRETLRQAGDFPDSVLPEEAKGRRDCRKQQVITIDPDDAKDFDDAICVEPAGPQWKLWVHIADVSHYVRPATALDKEARRRGNSTYLVDRVIPMLPEKLSNGLCSLKPNVDRLTKCVEFLLSNDGRVLRAEFYQAVIHSQRRFTYREAFGILQRRPQGRIEEMLHQANRLAQRLRRRRMEAGALALDFPEFKVRLDDKGYLHRVERVENDISHQLIEEFMLLANEAVGARLRKLHRSAIYRIHEQPDLERLDELRQELLGHGITCGNLAKIDEVRKLLQKLKTHPAGEALKISFLRSLKRARYSIEPIGHYGLAKKDYTHFTSPIRRYADLIVHRALFDKTGLAREALMQVTDHISFTERNSDDAEQDSKTIKLLSHLERQIKSNRREVYEATVTEVRNFGFFVELKKLGLVGMVRVSTLQDDFYEFDAKRCQLRGRRRRRIIKLGETVRVEPYTVDRFKKQANFTLARTGADAAGRVRPRRAASTMSARTARGSAARPERPPQRAKRAEGVEGS